MKGANEKDERERVPVSVLVPLPLNLIWNKTGIGQELKKGHDWKVGEGRGEGMTTWVVWRGKKVDELEFLVKEYIRYHYFIVPYRIIVPDVI